MNALLVKKIKKKTSLFVTLECLLMPKGVIRKNKEYNLYDSSYDKIGTSIVIGLQEDGKSKLVCENNNTRKCISIEVLLSSQSFPENEETLTFIIDKVLTINSELKKELNMFASLMDGSFLLKKKKFTPGKTFIIKELDKQIYKPTEKRIGITLEGGGLKGSFGVGVIHFMSTAGILNDDTELTLSSASTGSITSLLLAQRKKEAYEDALKQYWEIINLEDMLELTDNVKDILKKEEVAKNVVQRYFRTGSMDFDLVLNEAMDEFIDQPLYSWDTLKGGLKGAAIGSVFGPFGAGAGLVAGAVGGFLQASIDNLKEFGEAMACLEGQHSIGDITPVRNKLRQVTKTSNIHAAKTEMRMAVTSLKTHVTAYITEKGDLLYPKYIGNNEGYAIAEYDSFKITSIGGTQISNDQFLIEAALASGCFPGLFKPVEIIYEKTTINEDGVLISPPPVPEVFYDGGVRENMPFRILTQKSETNDISDIKTIVGVYCEPTTYNYRDFSNYSKDNLPTLSGILMHSFSTINNENSVNNLFVGKPMNLDGLHIDQKKSPKIIHVAPSIVPIGLTEAVPFYLRSSVWYGYLRGFDEFFISQHFTPANIEKLHEVGISKGKIRNNTDEIFLIIRSIYGIGAKITNKSFLSNYGKIDIKKPTNSTSYDNFGIPIDVFSDRDCDMKEYTGIKKITFDSAQCYFYFKAKIKLLDLLWERKLNFDAIFEKNRAKELFNSESYANYFFYGTYGFMKKCFFSQWWGVHSYLRSTVKRNIVRYDMMSLLNGKYKNILKHKDFTDKDFDWLSDDDYKNKAIDIIKDYTKKLHDNKGIVPFLEGRYNDNINIGLPYQDHTIIDFDRYKFGDKFTHVTNDFYVK